MTPKMTAARAHRLYEVRCKMIRARLPRSSREFAAAMSEAAKKYEGCMRAAAAEGDAQAAECLKAVEEHEYLYTAEEMAAAADLV